MDLDLRLYNTLSRSKEPFKPIHARSVRMYSCGPTVYDHAHIGHFRAYIAQDVIRRTLSFFGYTITHAMNITDVGHLASDADEGEDKLERRAKERGTDPLTLARAYEQEFWEDLAAVNVPKPEHVLRATDAISEQIAFIEKLLELGAAYITEQAIYFDVRTAKNYGALSGQRLEEKETGVRDDVITDINKKNPADFALWFFTIGRHAHHVLRWQSPWGTGFPGWHLECSAISRKLLGQPFDIHFGGVDHIPVHHTNEIAQSETAYGEPLALYWIHNNFSTVDGQKMSKSLGNTYTRGDLIEHGIAPLAYRYFTLTAHYRSQQNVTWEALEGAQEAYRKLLEQAFVLHEDTGTEGKRDAQEHRDAFAQALADDVNTPEALAATWTMLKDTTIVPSVRYATLLVFDEVLGFNIAASLERFKHTPKEVQELAAEREEARNKGDYAKADELRDRLSEAGYTVRDTGQGPMLFPL